MHDAQPSLDDLSLAFASLHRRARLTVVAFFQRLFRDHDKIVRARWTQAVDHSRGDAVVIRDVVFDFASGGCFNADNATYVASQHVELDPLAYALLMDLLLGHPEVLVSAFGLNVAVVATATTLATTQLAS